MKDGLSMQMLTPMVFIVAKILPFRGKKRRPNNMNKGFCGNQNLPNFEKKEKSIDFYLKALVGSHNIKCFE